MKVWSMTVEQEGKRVPTMSFFPDLKSVEITNLYLLVPER